MKRRRIRTQSDHRKVTYTHLRKTGLARYDLAEHAVGFFRFFAGAPPGFAEQATSVITAGLATGEDPQEAVRAALALHAYETAFWDALADGLG